MSLQKTVNSLSTAFMIAKMAWNVYKSINQPLITAEASTDLAYRPTAWSLSMGETLATSQPLMMKMSNINEILQEETNGVKKGIQYGWFFDAFIRESHTGTVRITDHPVQDGTNISDHAYNLPDKLTIEIFVSDVMDSIILDQFSSPETKAINAYQVLRKLKEQRQPLCVRTKMNYYKDMLIESMTTNDDSKTTKSMRCTVMLRQIIMAQVSQETAQSSKPYVSPASQKENKQASNGDSLGAKIVLP